MNESRLEREVRAWEQHGWSRVEATDEYVVLTKLDSTVCIAVGDRGGMFLTVGAKQPLQVPWTVAA